jgi:hypothetical protein
VELAWELLTEIERAPIDEEGEGEAADPEDYLERFAVYLGIRDAAWDPSADADALSDGEYEDEEGLPEAWREFTVLPIDQLRVL